MAARVIRRILVDHAQARGAVKRGHAMPKLSLDEAPNVAGEREWERVALDDALERLAMAERQSRMVELRFFIGLSAIEMLNSP